MKRYYIKTFGCQQNTVDSEKIAQILESSGLSATDNMEKADLIIVNSCSVRQASEDKVYGMGKKIKKLKEQNPDLKVILTGCMVGSAIGERKRLGLDSLKKKMGWVDEFVKINHLALTRPMGVLSPRFAGLQDDMAEAAAGFQDDTAGAEVIRLQDSRREVAYVSISTGCDNFCSYCVVPYARGPERSRPMPEIIKEVKKLVSQGVKEVTLLGQNVNSYGINSRIRANVTRMLANIANGTNIKLPFVQLLEKLNAISGLEKIHFLTSHPKDMSDQLIDAIARLSKVEKYIHLPIQSGDDKILQKMNRGYTVKQYKNLIAKIRKAIPGVRVGTDVIVGFPGETREQFGNTLQTFRDIKFDVVYAALYSPRPGTAAYRMGDDVVKKEKRRRYKKIVNLQKTNL